jgi:hypothetical protein
VLTEEPRQLVAVKRWHGGDILRRWQALESSGSETEHGRSLARRLILDTTVLVTAERGRTGSTTCSTTFAC